MKGLRKILWIGLLLFGTMPMAKATHIAGAELTYECVGNNVYHIVLKLYRDCFGGQAPFDDPVELFIFDGNSGATAYNISIPIPPMTPVIPLDNIDACVATPPPICVEEGVYEMDVLLPPRLGGYNIAWARCCRNNIITNLAAPECEGVSFLAHVPGPEVAVCNSMPEFNQQPSIFLCAGETYFFDYSATDPDGDSLVYEISNPYTGVDLLGAGAGNNSGNCGFNQPDPVVDPLFNPMGPPPYANVVYSPNHSFLNPFGPNSSISINPSTGYLTAFPANQGVYVLAVSVKEYRGGVLLSENKRDFQFHVINCLPQGTPPVLEHQLGGLNTIGDTILAPAGQPFCYTFTVEDSLVPSTIQVTPLSVSFGGNGGFPPPYATITTNGTTPPILGQICWTPACDYVGETVEMIISARDTNDCPNYNIVFDTIWVLVIPPPAAPPVTTTDISGIPTTNGDTIILNVQENFCFDFFIVDTLGGGNLSYENILMDPDGTVLNQVQGVTTYISGDTLYGTVCWETFCNFGRTYMFVTNGIDLFQCPPDNFSSDTVYLRVLDPYNPPPTTTTDISSNPVNNDTIIAPVHEEFCFLFEVIDTSLFGGQGLNFNFNIETLDGNLAGGEPPVYFATQNGDTVSGQVCWTPRCLNNDLLFRFVVEGVQENECLITNSTFDTVYVRVIEPINPPPLISHDLGPNYPDNYTIDLNDDESFCFPFTVEDTVRPTFVNFATEVFFSDGSPFNGSSPDIVVSFQNDSLIEADLCWTVPCELADQSFKIRIIATDTFDCNSSNTVYDSVLVNHVENPPDPVDVCGVTVIEGDAGIFLTWVANTESDGAGYIIYRQRDDEFVLTAIDTLFSYPDTSYTDITAEVDDYQYCYSVRAIDRCGRISDEVGSMCSILLSGDREDYQAALAWSPYTGWPGGVQNYDIYQNFPVEGTPESFLITLSNVTLTYQDQEATKPRVCYRVRGLAGPLACAPESWSNEICVEFPATLFVPSAFTPNGDDLNDIFSSFGEFEESFSMEIYDRWGKLLFATLNKNTGWDGTVNGKPQPEGVYVYKIVVRGFDGQELTANGTITLYR